MHGSSGESIQIWVGASEGFFVELEGFIAALAIHGVWVMIDAGKARKGAGHLALFHLIAERFVEIEILVLFADPNTNGGARIQTRDVLHKQIHRAIGTAEISVPAEHFLENLTHGGMRIRGHEFGVKQRTSQA